MTCAICDRYDVEKLVWLKINAEKKADMLQKALYKVMGITHPIDWTVVVREIEQM